MAGDDQILNRLEALRERIPSLEGGGPFSDQFVEWHGELMSLAARAVGDDAPEMHDLRAIRVEPPNELREEAAGAVPETAIRDAERAFFRKRLADFSEAIGAIVWLISRR